MRTDGLPNLGEQLIFLGSPLRFVHYDVVFQGKRDLQREADQQTQVGRAEHPAFRVRKNEDPEVVLPCLQAYGHQVGDALGQQRLLENLDLPSGKSRQRLLQVRETSEGDHSAPPVGELGDVIPGLRFLQLLQKLRRSEEHTSEL